MRVPSGAETELSKIVNGKADWMFCGHTSADHRTREATGACLRHLQMMGLTSELPA